MVQEGIIAVIRLAYFYGVITPPSADAEKAQAYKGGSGHKRGGGGLPSVCRGRGVPAKKEERARQPEGDVGKSRDGCQSQGDGKVIGRFAEYHSRRGARVVEPVEYGGIDGLEEVGEIRDIGCGNDETQRIEKMKKNAEER